MWQGDSSRAAVIIAGAGPAGMVAGITLSLYGVPVVLLEKRAEVEIAKLSRALVISTRSMELFRSWGLEDPIRRGAADVEPRGWRTATLASGDGVEVPLGAPTTEEARAISPTRPACAPQDHLEPILLAHLRGFDTADVRFGAELVSAGQDDQGLRAVIAGPGPGCSEQVQAEFLVGADGAHSTVRQQAGIGMEGPDDLGDYQRVEFRAPLADVVGDRRYLLNMITHPEVSGVLAPRGPDDRWGFSREARPGEPGIVDLPEDELIALLATATGVPGLRPRLERRWSFRFAAQMSERSRHGRVFLVGDAVHRVTPRGGTGMNMAIQDAYDLGWKLAWVLRGWAGAALLDSYEAERRRVAVHNVARSAQTDGARAETAEALGWDLDGRLAHHWLARDRGAVSTLDLLSDGFALFAGPGDDRWLRSDLHEQTSAPVRVERLDAQAAAAVGIEAGGAMLFRPDGKMAAHWPSFAPGAAVPLEFRSGR
jgi:putative polyketide hydroxylase